MFDPMTDEKMIETDRPTVLVVFGATGDLIRRKVAPAVFHLFSEGRLPKLFSIVGFAWDEFDTASFRGLIEDAVSVHLGSGTEVPERFKNCLSYHCGDFNKIEDYRRLAENLGFVDNEWQACSNKLFYLAVPPEYYRVILENLAASGLTSACSAEEGWTRVLLEKPFGKNIDEARDLDRMLARLFREEQVFRIDHYLAKETLQNILAFRFANNLLEEVWDRWSIEKIEVRLLEQIGIEGRGSFYDSIGALLDVGQNHLLQMVALVGMENPVELSPGRIRAKRSELLNQLHKLSESEMATAAIRGQYEGYRDEEGVAPDSVTETYFRVETVIDSPRWEGTQIVIEGGKKAPEVKKEIVVTFKHPQPCLCPPGGHRRNLIRFRIEPDPGIAIQFWSKTPGAGMELEKKTLEFAYETANQETGRTEAYTQLLLDCVHGDQTLFISSSEALAGWNFIDPIVAAWRKLPPPIYDYKAVELPRAAETFTAKTKVLTKEIGLIGLGKMGGNIADRLLERDWLVAGFSTIETEIKSLAESGLIGVGSLSELVETLTPPRLIWMMIPAGTAVESVIFGDNGLAALLEEGDIIVDAGNSFYKDTLDRAARLKLSGIKLVDVGVSGGPAGARGGAALMVGGEREEYEYLLPLFAELAVRQGVRFFPGSGAGHFVKMVHNGIEYGMMQAIAEGFNVLKRSEYEIDLIKAADAYNHGSVIESRLIGWLRSGLKQYGLDLDEVSGTVQSTGEGRWTEETAKELGAPAAGIEEAVDFREHSLEHPDYVGKILTVLRHQFGGHDLK